MSLPVVLAAIAYLVVEFLAARFVGDRSTAWPDLGQPVHQIVVRNVALQVAVHSLVESASFALTIRVCSAVANDRVTLIVDDPQTLRAVLEQLAGQVGSRVVMSIDARENRPLPTILCPDGRVADYLTIGRR